MTPGTRTITSLPGDLMGMLPSPLVPDYGHLHAQLAETSSREGSSTSVLEWSVTLTGEEARRILGTMARSDTPEWEYSREDNSHSF